MPITIRGELLSPGCHWDHERGEWVDEPWPDGVPRPATPKPPTLIVRGVSVIVQAYARWCMSRVTRRLDADRDAIEVEARGLGREL